MQTFFLKVYQKIINFKTTEQLVSYHDKCGILYMAKEIKKSIIFHD